MAKDVSGTAEDLTGIKRKVKKENINFIFSVMNAPDLPANQNQGWALDLIRLLIIQRQNYNNKMFHLAAIEIGIVKLTVM